MNTDPLIRILLITDHVNCVNLINKSLNDDFELINVNTPEESLTNFSEDKFDILILDLQVSGRNGLESFHELHEKYPDTPIIILTTDDDEQIGQQAMKYGAEDYLIKDEFNNKILIRSIKKSLIRKKAGAAPEIQDIKKSKSASKSKYFNVELLKGYEQGLSEIIEFLPDATFVIDKFGRVIAWNLAIQELTGVKSDEILGKGNYSHSIPFYGERKPMLIDLALKYDEELENRYRFITRDADALLAETEVLLNGKRHILWIKAVPLYDKKFNITGAIESIRDITELKRAQEQIEKSLEEKSVLLKEIHHRVKNNLQIISSLLNLQEDYVKEEPAALKVLKESKNRVISMALVHDMLYQSDDIRQINFSSYIDKLTRDLFYAYQGKKARKPKINDDQIRLNIETAIPLGLIISELVSNSLKYAFPDDKTGEISVELHSHPDEYELIISDNGIGFPKNLDHRNVESTLGLQLVNSLTDQLDGTIELDRSHGTEFTVRFKEQQYIKRI